MKKLSVFAFLSLFLLNSCYSTGGVTGKTMLGAPESPWWFNNAPRQDINYFYDKFSTSDLCIRWQRFYPGTHMSTKIRSEISRSLERRGENGLRCFDGNMDTQLSSKAKLRKAQQSALDAEIAAKNAERRAADALRRAREAEDSANWIRLNCPNGGFGYTCY